MVPERRLPGKKCCAIIIIDSRSMGYGFPVLLLSWRPHYDLLIFSGVDSPFPLTYLFAECAIHILLYSAPATTHPPPGRSPMVGTTVTHYRIPQKHNSGRKGPPLRVRSRFLRGSVVREGVPLPSCEALSRKTTFSSPDCISVRGMSPQIVCNVSGARS